MPDYNFGAVDPGGFMLGNDNTQLGMDIAAAKRKYMLPPIQNPGLGSPDDVIMNPATGQMEDKNGTPVKQVRRQALQPGQTGGIDDGSGPTQYVSADGTPLAGGVEGIRGPNFETLFRAVGGGGDGAKYAGKPGNNIMTIPDASGGAAPAMHSNVDSEQSFTGGVPAGGPGGHLLLPSIDTPFQGGPDEYGRPDPRNGKWYNYLGGGWMGTEPAVNDYAKQLVASALFDQKKQIIDQENQNKLDIANIGAKADMYKADQTFATAEAKAAAQAKKDNPGTIANPDLSLTGMAALNNYEPDVQKTAKMLINDQIQLPSGMALKTPYWIAVMNAAADVDPMYNAANFATRLQTRKSFTSGADAKNITSINTLVGHLDSLRAAANELHNGKFPILNKLANSYVTNTGGGSVGKFDATAKAVESELAAVFKGTGAPTDQEVKEWRKNFDAAQSPEQMQTVIKQAVELMGSRLSALQTKYEQSMGKMGDGKNIEVLNARSRDILSKMGVDVNRLEPGQAQDNPGVLSAAVAAPSGGRPPLSSFRR